MSRVKKAKEVVASERVIMEKDGNTFTLTLNNVTLLDAGLYVVNIENSAGSTKCSAELLVEGAYKLLSAPTTRQCAEQSVRRIFCARAVELEFFPLYDKLFS